MLDLSNLKFDYMKFISLPRCSHKFISKDGAGCSLTAFWYALGFEPRLIKCFKEEGYTGNHCYLPVFTHPDMLGIFSIGDLQNASNKLAGELFEGIDFSSNIAGLHDAGKESAAIEEILFLVKAKLNSEDPALCGVK